MVLQRYCESTYQKDVIKDLCRTVHLAQNDNHLVVDELFELSQIACHVHFQLCADLQSKHTDKILQQQI